MLGSEALVARIDHLFNVVFPVSGVICTLFIRLFLDNLSVPMALAVIVALSTSIGIFKFYTCYLGSVF